ncbi:MAG: alpha/beta hydrolase [Anaerolineae bacterium]|nr:alpha/beta hydrolase [Anaerolineae bacterium]
MAIFIGGFVWLATPVGASMPQAVDAMQSNRLVTVTQDTYLVFSPADEMPTVGFIVYPGAKVPPEAYAPIASAIADEGYLVVIVPMPLNFAIFNITAADGVIAQFPNIQTWAIGGHSLGGAMSAWYAYDNPDQFAGLVLWASYPDASRSLADSDLKVVSIYGELDGLATPEMVRGSGAFLPEDATFVEIMGGNHANFGWYGDQPGDNPATISRESQTDQIVDATVKLLKKLS